MKSKTKHSSGGRQFVTDEYPDQPFTIAEFKEANEEDSNLADYVKALKKLAVGETHREDLGAGGITIFKRVR